jgi:hypothetical protein
LRDDETSGLPFAKEDPGTVHPRSTGVAHAPHHNRDHGARRHAVGVQ